MLPETAEPVDTGRGDQRQFFNLLFVNQIADLRRLQIDIRNLVAPDLDLFRDCSRFQARIERECLRDGDINRGRAECLEGGHLDCHFVSADFKVGNAICPGIAAVGNTGSVGGQTSDRDFGAWDDRTSGIGDRALNRSGLGHRERRGQQQHSAPQKESQSLHFTLLFRPLTRGLDTGLANPIVTANRLWREIARRLANCTTR